MKAETKNGYSEYIQKFIDDAIADGFEMYEYDDAVHGHYIVLRSQPYYYENATGTFSFAILKDKQIIRCGYTSKTASSTMDVSFDRQ